jgi:hypothetical protein
MEIVCSLKKYNEAWDKKLNFLLDNYVTVELHNGYIDFRVQTGIKKKFFGIINTPTFKTYSVWVCDSFKRTSYGTLSKIDEKFYDLGFAASQETLQKLYKLEQVLVAEIIENW